MPKTNVYFTLLAQSDNHADAIYEAKSLLEKTVRDYPTGIQINECGTKREICRVFKDGTVTVKKDKE